jgi:hypothetical protein
MHRFLAVVSLSNSPQTDEDVLPLASRKRIQKQEQTPPTMKSALVVVKRSINTKTPSEVKSPQIADDKRIVANRSHACERGCVNICYYRISDLMKHYKRKHATTGEKSVSLPQNSIKHQCNHCSKVSSSSVE